MKDAPVHAGQSVDDAFQSILLANYEYMKSWLTQAYNRETIRGVHQTRVAFRRMRSLFSIYNRMIPKPVPPSTVSALPDSRKPSSPGWSVKVGATA